MPFVSSRSKENAPSDANSVDEPTSMCEAKDASADSSSSEDNDHEGRVHEMSVNNSAIVYAEYEDDPVGVVATHCSPTDHRASYSSALLPSEIEAQTQAVLQSGSDIVVRGYDPTRYAQQLEEEEEEKLSMTISNGAPDSRSPALPISTSKTTLLAAATVPTPYTEGSKGSHGASSNTSRTEEVTAHGTHIVRYRNGTRKETQSDGRVCVYFNNGDVKKRFPETGIVVYYYASTKTTHTSYANGLEVYEFPNNQVCRRLLYMHSAK
jgi:hypothetical protein